MKKNLLFRFFAMLLAAIIGVSACTPGNTSLPSTTPAHWTYEGNNRPVQPLNDRPLVEDNTP